MSDSSSHPIRKLEIQIDTPLVARLDQGGHIELECYQQMFGETEPVTMCVRFSPEASRALMNVVKTLLDKGLIALEDPLSKAFAH